MKSSPSPPLPIPGNHCSVHRSPFYLLHLGDNGVLVFLNLASFTQHTILHFHPLWCKWQDFILF